MVGFGHDRVKYWISFGCVAESVYFYKIILNKMFFKWAIAGLFYLFSSFQYS